MIPEDTPTTDDRMIIEDLMEVVAEEGSVEVAEDGEAVEIDTNLTSFIFRNAFHKENSASHA